jgi:rubrerythrin
MTGEIKEKERAMTLTDDNVKTAIIGEAMALLKYTAFALQARQEGHHEIAHLFLDAAGAETIHGISHLRLAGGIGTTWENLDESSNEADNEIEAIYPRFIRQAESDEQPDAAASFELAVERGQHDREMFQTALKSLSR